MKIDKFVSYEDQMTEGVEEADSWYEKNILQRTKDCPSFREIGQLGYLAGLAHGEKKYKREGMLMAAEEIDGNDIGYPLKRSFRAEAAEEIRKAAEELSNE